MLYFQLSLATPSPKDLFTGRKNLILSKIRAFFRPTKIRAVYSTGRWLTCVWRLGAYAISLAHDREGF